MLSDERLLGFTRAMADAVRSGLPAAQTLRRLADRHGGRLRSAAEAVDRGEPMHAALAAQRLLPPLLLAVIRAGEESGKLDVFLDRFAASLETELDFRRKLSRVLVYPAFAALLAAAIFIVFASKAAPILLEPLVEAGATLPAAALKLVALGLWLSRAWPWLLGGLVAVLLAARALARSGPGRMAWALAGHGVPGVRYATEHGRWQRLESSLELLLAAGLRPRQIMEILEDSFRHDLLTRARLSRGAERLAAGSSFFEALSRCLPSDDRDQFEVAERAGRLDETLKKLAEGHRERQLHRLKVAATGIQLASLVALAPMVAALWLSIAGTGMAAVGAALQDATALAGSPSARRPLPALAPPADSGFNERQARKVVGYMQEHGVREPRKFETPKLKARKSMKGLQPSSIEPSSIKNFE